MKKMLLMAAIAAATMVGSSAGAGELPTFEVTGFPITRHQVAVLGARAIQEQSANPTLMFGGMPASPHQITVLTPRSGIKAEAMAPQRTTVGLVAELPRSQ